VQQLSRSLKVIAVAMVIGLSTIGVSTNAQGIAPAVKAPKPGSAVRIASITPSLVRVDQQRAELPSVVFQGVDSKTRVSVNFGDATSKSARGKCSVQVARKHPNRCRVTLSHTYAEPGIYTITALAPRGRLEHTLEVDPKPVGWKPPPGQVFDGWKMSYDSATFHPCQRVTWFLDRSKEPPDRDSMIADVRASLDVLTAATGLRFVEAQDADSARLMFRWNDLARLPWFDEKTTAYGTVTDEAKGEVVFSTTNSWTSNVWAGSGIKRIPDAEVPGRFLVADGRQTIVIHEVMHVLGFDHVDDRASIMHPQPRNGTTFSAGDTAGLNAMYASNPCPRIPD